MTIESIEDRDGRVWKGKVVEVTNPSSDPLLAIFSCGLSAMSDCKDTVTVEVNGERHTGSRLE